LVVVKDDVSGKVTRFSYGPSNSNPLKPGKLVSHSGEATPTDKTDASAAAKFLGDPSSAAKEGITGEKIHASDADVIAAGEAMNSALGTPSSPTATAPNYRMVPVANSSANSNSAAYGIAHDATGIDSPGAQALPAGARSPGWNEHDNITR